MFRSKPAKPVPEPDPPIRRSKVIAHLQAYMEHLDGDPDNDELYRRLNETGKGLTRAEHAAVHDALKRNGY